MSKNKLTNYTLIIIILLSFFIGLYFNENSTGGASNDFPYALLNFQLFLSNELKNIPWEKYSSTSLPLYYLILKLIFSEANKANLIIANLFFSFLSVLFLYKIFLKNIYQKKIDKSYLLLFSSLLMFSPYFRSSNYWGLEEVTGILMLILTFYFFIEYKLEEKKIYLILTILFSSLAFLSRQSYAFLMIFVFFQIFNFRKILSYRNMLIVSFFIIFISPSIYFFYNWMGLLTPLAINEGRVLSINIYNFPVILTIILIYLIPFMYLSFSNLNDFIKFYKKKYLFLLSTFILFIIILINYKFDEVGGGAVIKILLYFDLNFYTKIFVLSILSSMSLTYMINSLDKKILLCLACLIIVFVTINLIFQEYFDPITFIILASLYNFKNINYKKIRNFIIISFFYYGFFLLGANFYYSLI